jgi:hypothetical protein
MEAIPEGHIKLHGAEPHNLYPTKYIWMMNHEDTT